MYADSQLYFAERVGSLQLVLTQEGIASERNYEEEGLVRTFSSSLW